MITETNVAGFPRRRSRRAFTLIEVVIALAIFAFAVVVLASTYINVLLSVESVKEDKALQDDMAFVRSQVLTQSDLTVVQAGGQVQTQNLGLASWTATVNPMDTPDLFSVDLEVSFDPQNGGKTRTIQETLYLLRPTWSDPTAREALRTDTARRFQEDVKQKRPL